MPAPKPKSAPRPRFKGKKLKGRINARMKSLDRSQKKAKKWIGIGTGTAAAFDPHIGVPIGAVGVAFGLHEAVGRAALSRKLIKHPKAAALMAKEYMGTEYETFFKKTAEKAAKRREKELAKWKADQTNGKGRTRRKRRVLKASPGKFRIPSDARAKSKK